MRVTDQQRRQIASRLRQMADGVENGTERVTHYVDTPSRFVVHTESDYLYYPVYCAGTPTTLRVRVVPNTTATTLGLR